MILEFKRYSQFETMIHVHPMHVKCIVPTLDRSVEADKDGQDFAAKIFFTDGSSEESVEGFRVINSRWKRALRAWLPPAGPE